MLACLALGLLAAGVRAADPPSAPNGLLDGEIDRLLRQWHAKTSTFNSLYTQFTRTVKDRAFRNEKTNEGSAWFLAPNRARMDIKADKFGAGRELFLLCERDRAANAAGGLEVWHYRFDNPNDVKEKSKAPTGELKIFELPADRGVNLQQDGPLKLMFGVNPEHAHGRYEFAILGKQGKLTAVRITPKLQQDRDEFLAAEVLLNVETFLPEKLLLRENAETTATYVFKDTQTGVQVDEKYFKPQKPTNWRVTRDKLTERGPGNVGAKPANPPR